MQDVARIMVYLESISVAGYIITLIKFIVHGYSGVEQITASVSQTGEIWPYEIWPIDNKDQSTRLSSSSMNRGLPANILPQHSIH